MPDSGTERSPSPPAPSSSSGQAKGKGKAKAKPKDTGTPAQSTNDDPSESTPLLSSSSTPRYDGDDDSITSASPPPKLASKRTSQLPSIVAIILLLLLTLAIMIGAFFAPSNVELYAKQAIVVEPTNLSLESLTTDGVRVRIQATFHLDSSRVGDERARRIGKSVTWLVGKIGTDATTVSVYQASESDILLGTAAIPPLAVSLVDGETTTIDFIAEVVPGDPEAFRSIANQWLEGKLDSITLLGKANIPLRSGFIPLGTHPIAETLKFEASKIPTLPPYTISRLTFGDVPTPGSSKLSVGADVTIVTHNDYPVQLNVPKLGFEILVADCSAQDPFIPVAEATVFDTLVKPNADFEIQAQGLVKEIPSALKRACPESGSSPLDNVVRQFLRGGDPPVFVRGRKLPDSDTPDWITDILSSVTVPVPFPGQSLDNLIQNFSLAEANFKLPDPGAAPGTPEANPRITGTVEVLVLLPKGMNLGVNVTSLRATADVIYRKRKFGELDLRKWQPSESLRIDDGGGADPMLKIISHVEDVPLKITDSDVFAEIVQELLFGGEVLIDIDALVSIKVDTVLGQLVLREVPTQGQIPVKQDAMPGGSLDDLAPQVGHVRIVSTSPTSVSIEALVNATNPTPYTANVPYISVQIVKNGSVIGEVSAENINVSSGLNENIPVRATWKAADAGSEAGQIGRDLVSQYISGYNVTVDVKMYPGSLPSAPLIGEGLSKINLTVAAPKLQLPGDEEDDKNGRFIRDAKFHVFTSAAEFILVSPLEYDILYIDWINATAFYNHSEPVGHILYDIPLAASPGKSRTPKLPVDWSVGSIGFDAVLKAVGGELELDARADVTVRLGAFQETIWFEGRGIGAQIRP